MHHDAARQSGGASPVTWQGQLSRVRSSLFSVPLIVFSTIVFGTTSFLASFFDSTGKFQDLISRAWAKILLRVSFVRVRVAGLEKLDPGCQYVFVANHTSLMDPVALLSGLPNPFLFFATKRLYEIPFLGTHLKRAGHIALDHSHVRTLVKEGMRTLVDRRTSVLLFPEGVRSNQPLRAFHEGAAYIAIKAGVSVVPVAIVGTPDVLPMGTHHIRGGRVELRIGDSISAVGLNPRDRQDFNRRLHAEVARLLGQN